MLELSRRQITRRSRGAAALALVAPAARAGDLLLRDLAVDGDAELGRRFTLFTPRGLAKDERVPLVVLLHGLGEAGDPRAGAYAWTERYGLASSYDRLRTPPIQRISKRLDWTDARLGQVNADLLRTPFRGLAFACPVTPNVAKSEAIRSSGARSLRELARRRRRPARAQGSARRPRRHAYAPRRLLDGRIRRPRGVSPPPRRLRRLGRRPDHLRRPTRGELRRPPRQGRQEGPRPIHLETSEQDRFREANQLLAAELKKRAVAHQLLVLPGRTTSPGCARPGLSKCSSGTTACRDSGACRWIDERIRRELYLARIQMPPKKSSEEEVPRVTWGGARKGAGRKRHALSGLRHETRAELTGWTPVHVTLKVSPLVPSLRTPPCLRVVRRALREGRERDGFRLVHYAILPDRLHLLVEASDKTALSSGIRGVVDPARASAQRHPRAGGAGVRGSVSRPSAHHAARGSGCPRRGAANASSRGEKAPPSAPRPVLVGAALRRLHRRPSARAGTLG